MTKGSTIDIASEYDEERDDGKIVVRQKGTIQMLEEWLAKKVRTPDTKPIEEAISAFKEVRRLRQRPAHAIDEDDFNQEYFKQQREMMIQAYAGIRTLRLLFTNHPNVKSYVIPNWLREGKIWTF